MGSKINLCFDGLDAVRDRHGALTDVEEGMVIFSVADTDDLMRREANPTQGVLETGRLVHAGWKHHHGPSVEHDVELQTKIANCLQHGRFMRPPRGQNNASRYERFYAALGQALGQTARRWRTKRLRLARARPVDHCAIFENDGVEQLHLRAVRSKFLERTSSHQDATPSRRSEPLERCARSLRHSARIGDGAVEIAG